MQRILVNDYRVAAARFLKKEQGYKFVTLLGKGSYGTVIEMKNPHLGSVAVKIVGRQSSNKFEISEWVNFNHPNILRCMCVYDHHPQFTIFVTDLMRTNLTKRLGEIAHREDPKAIERNKRYLKQVLLGVRYLHSKDLCHLDLRADNVFVTFDDDVVVADFSGLSPSTEKKNFCPLPKCFRPPEMFIESSGRHRTKVHPLPIDLWAYGLLSVHMFYLKKFCKLVVKQHATESEAAKYVEAFQDPVNVNLVLRKSYPKSDPPDGFAEDFGDFISGFLNNNPRKRRSALEGLRHAFLSPSRQRSIQRPTWEAASTSGFPSSHSPKRSVHSIGNATLSDEDSFEQESDREPDRELTVSDNTGWELRKEKEQNLSGSLTSLTDSVDNGSGSSSLVCEFPDCSCSRRKKTDLNHSKSTSDAKPPKIAKYGRQNYRHVSNTLSEEVFPENGRKRDPGRKNEDSVDDDAIEKQSPVLKSKWDSFVTKIGHLKRWKP